MGYNWSVAGKDRLNANDFKSNLFAIIALLGGAALVMIGLVSGAAYLLLALLLSAALAPLSSMVSLASLAALCLGLGGLLLWHGWRAVRRVPDAPFCPPRLWAWLILLAVALGLGQAVLSYSLAPRLAFPPFHVLAGALPAVSVLAWVGRRLGRASRQRVVVGQVSSGITIAGPAAIVLVGLAALALVLALSLLVAMMPGGQQALQSLARQIQDPDNLLSLALTPAGLAGAFLLLVVISPLVEELLKPIGLLLVRRRPGQAEAFLLGLAGAAGFAALEGVLNSTIDLDAWLSVALMRIGTSLMHCLAGGLVGLGWHALRSARRPWRAVGLYLSAVALHAVWNSIALGIAALSLASPTLGAAMASLGGALLLGALGLLIVACIVALALLVRWLQANLPAAEGMEPTQGGMV